MNPSGRLKKVLPGYHAQSLAEIKRRIPFACVPVVRK